MSSLRRVPRVYVPLAVTTMFGPLLIILLQGDPIDPKAAGLAFVVLLLWAPARPAHGGRWASDAHGMANRLHRGRLTG